SQKSDQRPAARKPPPRAAAKAGAPPGAKPAGVASTPPPRPTITSHAPGVRNATEAPAEPTTLRTGDTVAGAFVVQRYLGSSGGAISYLCTEKSSDELVVIKVLSRDYPGDE